MDDEGDEQPNVLITIEGKHTDSEHESNPTAKGEEEEEEEEVPPLQESDFSSNHAGHSNWGDETTLKTPRFDAPQFMQLLVSCDPVIKQIQDCMTEKKRVHFLIPDRAAGHVFLDAATAWRELECMLFVEDEKDHLLLVSSKGVAAVLSSETVTVYDGPIPSTRILAEDAPHREYGIIYAFSINTEDVDCQVHLVDAVVIPGVYPMEDNGDVTRSASRGSMESLAFNPYIPLMLT